MPDLEQAAEAPAEAEPVGKYDAFAEKVLAQAEAARPKQRAKPADDDEVPF